MNDAREGGNGRPMSGKAQAQNGHVYVYNKTRDICGYGGYRRWQLPQPSRGTAR